MIGRLISGRYRLIAPLGEGGMATIWRAVDEQLDREVAVKLLRPQFSADPGFAARFKQEARSAGGLSHPNIVGVYDYGTDGADGDQYIVMELIDGNDLSTILRDRGSLSTTDAVRVAIGVAAALEVAHRKGIVHRDVKPGNILITDAGDVKVTDFGIARAVSEASMTVTGTTLGSVHYFSPEQARGDEVTGASDVYALAIVLFEMLTGRRPFEGDSAAAVALKRLNEDAPKPTAVGHPLSPGLEAIVMRALSRDPAQRFPDAGAFAEALRVWRRDPDAATPLVGAAGVPVAPTPPAGEPTVYVPPRVTRPADRVPVAPPPRRMDPYPPDGDDGQPWWVWLLAVLAVALLGAIGFLAAQLLGGFDQPTASPTPSAVTVTVPACEGVTATTLRAQLADLDLEPDEQQESSDDVDDGDVIRCEPASGETVPAGGKVGVFVSSGEEFVTVPSLSGQTLSQAEVTLREFELRVGDIRREPSANIPDGSVITSDPPPGTDEPVGSQIDLIVSTGPTPSPTPIPTPVPTPIPTPVPTPPPTPPPTPSTEPTLPPP